MPEARSRPVRNRRLVPLGGRWSQQEDPGAVPIGRTGHAVHFAASGASGFRRRRRSGPVPCHYAPERRPNLSCLRCFLLLPYVPALRPVRLDAADARVRGRGTGGMRAGEWWCGHPGHQQPWQDRNDKARLAGCISEP
jgi:hypothetical protein